MKVTVEENKVYEIDFSIAGQWLIFESSGEKKIVITQSETNSREFSGIVIIDETGEHQVNELENHFIKNVFKKFNGTITIEQ